MPKLGVNIDHVATLRQARIGSPKEIGSPVYPDPLAAARVCKSAGAHSVVMHLREDRRHIQDADVFRVKEAVAIRLNLEMAVAASVMKTALRLVPDQVTLVPERREEKTTEGGLNLLRRPAELRRACGKFRKKKIEISLFIDPDLRQVDEARRLGADAVEFHTGDYANRRGRARARELARLRKAVAHARGAGLQAHAGHGLDYANVRPVAAIPGIGELNIGYSIVSRSVWMGFERAVSDMLRLVR